MIALLRAMAGLILWAIAFATLYALQGLSCALGWAEWQLAGVSFARLILIATYATSVVVLAILCWTYRLQAVRREFLDRQAFAGAVAGLFGVIFTGMPVIAASLCR